MLNMVVNKEKVCKFVRLYVQFLIDKTKTEFNVGR